MKTKITLFLAAAVILFSFTVVSKTSSVNENKTASTSTKTDNNTPQGGFAMEDRNQWD